MWIFSVAVYSCCMWFFFDRDRYRRWHRWPTGRSAPVHLKSIHRRTTTPLNSLYWGRLDVASAYVTAQQSQSDDTRVLSLILSLCICLHVCLCVYLCLSLCVSLFVSGCLCVLVVLCMYGFVSVFMSVSVYLCLSVCVWFSLCACLPFCVYGLVYQSFLLHLCVFVSVYIALSFFYINICGKVNIPASLHC